MTKEKIWLSSPHMGKNELKYVKQAFEENWIAPLGPNVDAFEEQLAAFVGVRSVAALSSGTAAIHLGLILNGVGQGDEVLCQSFTFSATANPIVYQGAVPVFIDSEPGTWNMDPVMLEKAIQDRISKGKKPKLIIPVHLYGMPAKMDEIKQISDTYGIPILEDAAEALGSSINGKNAGSFGQMGVLSFNGNKIITTSGGGALVSDDEAMIKKARFLSTQARDPAPHYQHSHIGYNYRISNICAGIGRGQMEVVEKRIARRRANFDYYSERLGKFKGVSFQQCPKGYYSNRWLTAIIVDPAITGVSVNEIRTRLEKENIESRPLWKPLHLQPIFENYPFYGTVVSEALFSKGLCLPSGSNLSKKNMEIISSIIIDMLKKK